jgi:hypothetical protein
MLECLLVLIVYVIVAVIVWYVIQELLKVFWTPPPPVINLIGLLLGLIVLIGALNCIGVFADGRFPMLHR